LVKSPSKRCGSSAGVMLVLGGVLRYSSMMVVVVRMTRIQVVGRRIKSRRAVEKSKSSEKDFSLAERTIANGAVLLRIELRIYVVYGGHAESAPFLLESDSSLEPRTEP